MKMGMICDNGVLVNSLMKDLETDKKLNNKMFISVCYLTVNQFAIFKGSYPIGDNGNWFESTLPKTQK